MRLDDINKHWTDLIDSINNVYNNKMIHSATNFTRKDARDVSNWVNVKLNLEMHRQHTRKYPTIQIGDNATNFIKEK